VSEQLDKDILLAIEMIVGIYYFICKSPFFLVLFELSYDYQKFADASYEISKTEKRLIFIVGSQFSQDRVLTMRVSIV